MDTLTPLQIACGLAAILSAIGFVVLVLRARHRRTALRSQYGAEYDRMIRETGNVQTAEAALGRRAKRVSGFDLRPLTITQREDYIAAWRGVQIRFVDDPGGALDQADVLVADVMVARGYPVADFDRRAADLSVDHPDVVQFYRAAHDIALAHARNEATTEDMRHAMIHYRALFDELVNEPGAALGQPSPRRIPPERVVR